MAEAVETMAVRPKNGYYRWYICNGSTYLTLPHPLALNARLRIQGLQARVIEITVSIKVLVK